MIYSDINTFIFLKAEFFSYDSHHKINMDIYHNGKQGGFRYVFLSYTLQ